MEAELKAIEKFWSSMVTEDGYAKYLSSTFKVSPDVEVKALALLTRLTFLMSIGMKNDRDGSVRNEEYLLREIIKIGENYSSHNICCQKTKLALDNLVKNFKQRGCQANDMTSMSHDVTSESLNLNDRTNSHEKGEFLFNKQSTGKYSHSSKLEQPYEILAIETQKLDACLPRKNVCAVPETIVIENSQHKSDNIMEKTPNKGYEDFNVYTAKKNGYNNGGEELGNIDDASLSPILGKKQNVQRVAKKEVICSSNNLFNSPENIKYSNKFERPEGQLPTQKDIRITSASVSIAASDIPISSTAKAIDPHLKKSLDFTRFPGYKLNIGNLNSNVNEITRNKIEKQDSKLLSLNQDNSRSSSSKCLTPESISNSPSLLICSKSSLPQMVIPPQLNTKKESSELSKKLSTLIVSPSKLSNLGSKKFVSSTETHKQKHNDSISGISKSSSDFICSSSNHVDEHVPTTLISVENICSPPKKQLSSLRKHKSLFCSRPISKKAKVSPLPRTITEFHSSKIKAEVSFTSTPKRMLRQTTLTQDCFLRKANEIKASNNKKKLQIMDKDDFVLNEAIEKSLKTKETEDMLRRKKDQLMKLNDTVKGNLASPVKTTSSDEFEKDLFVCTPEEVPKNVTNYFSDGNLSTLRGSPSKLPSLINSKGNKKKILSLSFENKISCSRASPTVEVGLKDDKEPVNTKGPCTKLNEEEILAQLEDDSQVMDVQLDFNNSFKSKNQPGKQFEDIQLLEDSFDFVPAKTEEPSYAYKGAVIRKKAEKHKVDGWECHECKDYFHSKGLSEEQKKAVLNKCSRHRSKFNHVTNTPKGFWNADWDSMNEKNETQLENSHPQNAFSKTKKKESKASFTTFNEASFADNGQKIINLNHQDISMSIDDKKKVKSKRNHNFTDSEFDAIGGRQESTEFGKVKKSRSKSIGKKSGENACPALKLEPEASSVGCWDDISIEDVSTSKDIVKKTKKKRKHQFTDMEVEDLGVLLEPKKKRKEKHYHSKEQELVGKEDNKEKKVENTQLRYLEEGWIQTRSSKL